MRGYRPRAALWQGPGFTKWEKHFIGTLFNHFCRVAVKLMEVNGLSGNYSIRSNAVNKYVYLNAFLA
jgi:hypothetical protein